MSTSNYMPDVVVEIAFSAGLRTPAADYVWTDVSDYVELEQLVTITGGRPDERSTCDPNYLTLTLDNRDGRFTFGRVTSPYYPNVKLDRPIRVKTTPVDGVESVQFLGFINQWPTAWNGTDAYARALVTASSRMQRLSYKAQLRSIVEETILAAHPVAYYPLSEPAGATRANDASGLSAPHLSEVGNPPAITFGTAAGPETDSLTAAQFAGGAYLSGAHPFVAANGACSVVAFFSIDSAPSPEETLFSLTSDPLASSTDRLTVQMGSGGNLSTLGPASLSAPTSYADAATHCVAVTWAPGRIRLYVDGVVVDDDTTVAATHAVFNRLDLGAGQGGSPWAGVLAHAAVFATELTATQVADICTAGDDGYAGDSTDTRLERYAALAGIPTAEVAAETGSTTVAHIDSTGKQILELLRTVEATEGGVLFDARDGTLTLHNRSHRYVMDSAFTLDMLKHQVGADYEQQVDRTYILNDVTASNLDGTVTAHRIDEDSRNGEEGYGPMVTSLETASADDDEPLQMAAWQVYQFKDPKPRVSTLTIDALAQVDDTPSCADVLAVTVGDKVTVSNHPQQAAYAQVDYFVEGWTEVYGPESLTLTWNVSPSAPYDQVLIVGDAVRGVVGTNPVAY